MSKKKGLAIFTIIFGIIILIGIIVGIFYGTGVLQESIGYGSGLTIKSMSKNVDIISQDTDLKGVWWLINAYSGGGQSIAGTLTPEQTKSLTGYQTKYPLEIKVGALNEKINYEIKNTGTQVYYYFDTIVKSSCSCDSSCWTHPDASACPSGTDYTVNFLGEANLFTKYTCERHCFKKTQIGVLGTVAPTNVKGDVQVNLTVNNELISKKIEIGSSADFVSSTKGLVAQVQYPANGWTGNYPKDTSNFYALYDIYKEKNLWTLTSKERYTNYVSQRAVFENWASSFEQVKYSGSTVKQQYSNALADLNNKLAKLNTEANGMRNDALSITQNQVWGNRNDQNNGKITLDTSGQLTIADLVFKVRADWLGIVINVGKPSIVSKSCQTFKAGDTSKITLEVKNIGGADGNFVPSVICNNIKQTYNIFSVPISKGETKTIEVPIDAGNFAPSSTTSDTCKIRVEEYNKPSNYIESSVTCSIETPALCQEGTIDAIGGCIRKCVNGKPTQLKCCEQGETLLLDPNKINDEFGGYYCYKGGCPEGLIDCDGVCKESCEVPGECKFTWYKLGIDGILCTLKIWLIKLKLLFSIVFGIISGILALSFSLKFTEKSGTGLKIGLGLGSLIVFGLTVGILVWIFASQLMFLVILTIVLISLGIIRGFLNKIKRITQ